MGLVRFTYTPPYTAFGRVSEGAGSVTPTLSLSEPSDHAVTVTINGGYNPGSLDYDASARTVTFAPGQITASFTAAIFEDALYEGDEYLEFHITSVSGGEIDKSSSSLVNWYAVIADNDQPAGPTARFTYTPPYTAFGRVSEGAGAVTPTRLAR
jgi:hypothetical protein